MNKSMFCGQCGSKLPNEARYCGICGASVEMTPSNQENSMPPAKETRQVSDVTVVEKSKTKIILTMVGSIAFLLCGIWLISSYAAVSVVISLIGILSLLLFGAGLIGGISMLSHSGPGLRLDSHGFELMATKIKTGPVSWAEVKGYRIVEIFGQKFISIQVKDPDAFLRRLGPTARALAQANMAEEFGGGPIGIAASTLAIDFNSLVALFNRYLQRYADSSEG